MTPKKKQEPKKKQAQKQAVDVSMFDENKVEEAKQGGQRIKRRRDKEADAFQLPPDI